MEIELRGLAKHYGRTVAVDEVDTALPRGEMLALLGPSGCGKTTTLRMVSGFVAPTRGRVIVQGRDVTDLPPYRRDTGLVFQNYALFPHMTVSQNIAFGLKRRAVADGEIARRVRAMIGMLRLDGLEDRLPARLSGGQQQRVAVARALVINPTVLLLDEPFSNLDAKLRESTRVELRRIQRDLGLTAIFVTHDQQEAMAVADRIAVMDLGRVVQQGSAADVYERPANRFVAGFIGQADFVDGHLEAAPGAMRFVADGGETLTVPADTLAPDASPGAAATLMLRPESLRLVAPDAGAAFAGRIELVTYQGAYAHVTLRRPQGGTLVVECRSRERALPVAGEAVGVAVDLAAMRVFGRAPTDGV